MIDICQKVQEEVQKHPELADKIQAILDRCREQGGVKPNAAPGDGGDDGSGNHVPTPPPPPKS